MSVTARLSDLLIAVIAAIAIAGCGDLAAEPVDEPDSAPRTARNGTPAARDGERPGGGTALAALEQLAVKGRAPKTGYDREQFGGDWTSREGCDTRARILTRDLRGPAYRAGAPATSRPASWRTPTPARAIRFSAAARQRSTSTTSSRSGTPGRRAPSSGPTSGASVRQRPAEPARRRRAANRHKGDGDAATWLPPNKPFRCAYVARQIAVKRRYRAWVTAAERDAMARVLARCPGTR